MVRIDSQVYGVLYPPNPGEIPLLAMDFFSLAFSNPAFFHAHCFLAATIADITRSSLFYSVTPEIRRHKAEAIHLINKELNKGKDVPEETALAVVALIREASELVGNEAANVKTEAEAEVSPFKVPFI